MRFNILTVDEFGLTNIELTSMLKNFNVHVNNVKDADAAERTFKTQKLNYNAIVWAMNAVDYSVFDAIKLLKEKEDFKNIPIVVISKFTDKRYIIKAIESGAIEYIAKPYNEETVLSKLCRVIGIPFEKSEGNMLDEDIITFNFSEMFNKELKAASRGGYPFSLIMATIVHKARIDKGLDDINNIMILINRVFKNNLRETDSSFQYSSSKLIILLPFSNKEGTKEIEEKLNNIYESNSMIKKKNQGYIFVTSSISYPEDGKIKHVLLHKLEEAFDENVAKANKSE